MVTSVLRLQGRRAGNSAVTEALGDAQARIEVIAAIHDSLSREGATHVDFDALVGSLLGLIRHDGVKLESVVHGRFGTLNSRVATPLAMAVSELIHNVVEHSGATEILVTAERDKGHLRAIVSDNGVGTRAIGSTAHAAPELRVGINDCVGFGVWRTSWSGNDRTSADERAWKYGDPCDDQNSGCAKRGWRLSGCASA